MSHPRQALASVDAGVLERRQDQERIDPRDHLGRQEHVRGGRRIQPEARSALGAEGSP
jgi:hypothetical protein